MDIKLQNNLVEAVVNSQGAELTSFILKQDGTEYMWQADKTVWGRHAPVLFPIVGRVNNNKYMVEGQEYELTQHGFARDRDFEIVDSGADFVVLRLTADHETKAKYPYNFQLDISYTLKGSSIITGYRVKNLDNKPLDFSIGAHPGFNCPLIEGETIKDYYLEFEQRETADIYYLENGLIAGRKAYLDNEKIIALTPDLFKDDALIFKNLQSVEVTLKSKKSAKQVQVRFAGFPYLGIWSKPSGGAFVCIEPWCGVTDELNRKGSFIEKECIYSLERGQDFWREFSIAIS